MPKTIFTWGAELWKRLGTEHELDPIKRLEYQALRKITGAYHGSSHEKLLGIAPRNQARRHLGLMGSEEAKDQRLTNTAAN